MVGSWQHEGSRGSTIDITDFRGAEISRKKEGDVFKFVMKTKRGYLSHLLAMSVTCEKKYSLSLLGLLRKR